MTIATGRKLLLVASTGGHLAELLRLHPLLDPTEDSLWVTFRTPQSEALLAGRRVHYVRYIRPRDLGSIVIVFVGLVRLLLKERFDGAVSTGSGIALAVFSAAILHRIPTHYIESLGRVNGPSTTGKVLASMPVTNVYAQSGDWGRGRWQRHPSVLSTYRVSSRPPRGDRPRLFVTLGTIEGYRFDSVVDAVLASGYADERTVWQVGFTSRHDLPGTVYEQMSSADYCAAAREADVVVSHAGVGSLLVLLEEGVFPVLAVRRGHRGEHVDDHQMQLGAMVRSLGLGLVVEGPELTADTIRTAMTCEVLGDAEPTPELLAG